MIPIPQELLEQFERGNVLLFIGERIVRDAEGQAIIDLLTSQLADRSHVADEPTLFAGPSRPTNSPRRQPLGIHRLYPRRPRHLWQTKPPQPFHHRTVELVQTHQSKTLITTAYDDLLILRGASPSEPRAARLATGGFSEFTPSGSADPRLLRRFGP